MANNKKQSIHYICKSTIIYHTHYLFHINMCSRYLRWPEPWLMTYSWPSVFLKGKVLTYSPQLPYWDIRVSQTTFTQLGQLWRTEQIMPAPRQSPIQLLTQPNVAWQYDFVSSFLCIPTTVKRWTEGSGKHW